MIDCSHANSNKNYRRQALVVECIVKRIPEEVDWIGGLMLESHLLPGNQTVSPHRNDELIYGQSITDACIGFTETEVLLESLAEAMIKN